MADAKKELPNVKALSEFRMKGEVVEKGEVVSKKDFARKSDWQNLVHMSPKPRAEETDEKVGKPKGEKGLPGAGK